MVNRIVISFLFVTTACLPACKTTARNTIIPLTDSAEALPPVSSIVNTAYAPQAAVTADSVYVLRQTSACEQQKHWHVPLYIVRHPQVTGSELSGETEVEALERSRHTPASTKIFATW